MWSYRQLNRIDFRILPILAALMAISTLVLSSFSGNHGLEGNEELFMTPIVMQQLQRFGVGIVMFIFFAGFDYNKLRESAWILYGIMILALIGLFFVEPIRGVQRWYRIPILNASIQPSEYANLIVIITLSWFLERRKEHSSDLSTALFSALIVGIPFLLIVKQPDLDAALVLFPIALVMFYYGDIHPVIFKIMISITAISVILVALMFLGLLPYEVLRPYATQIIKEYQFERLNPNTSHQKAAATAIAIGGLTGTGWKKSEFTGRGWLPFPYTDSVFAAFGEEFGFMGLLFLIALFYALIYCCFQVTAMVKDHFGRLLSAGLSVYLAIHVIVNIGMMCGFLPITGVPLILVTYGGSSILSTMIALGILQSIYSRRFMF
jgi:rod shape determining protein RodA